MHAFAVLLAVTLSTIPPTPLVEKTQTGQALNFDLLLVNDGAEKVVIEEIEATVLGAKDVMVAQRRLAQNGGSIETIPSREIAPGAKLVVFNPFHEFESDIALNAIRYDITFEDGKSVSTIVKPRVYDTKADLILPIRGARIFVHDGHDFYSHHRRLDITGTMTTRLGIHENMTRYAYDFVLIDEQGRMQSMGAEIVAPADGVVVKAAGDRPDGDERKPMQLEEVLKDLSLLFGNFVTIDHGNGEFSLLAHLRKGTVSVKPGERVKRGQKIGEVGFSGDAIFPHLHYQLQRDADFGDGLPSYFRDFSRFNGTSFVRVKRGQVDTGDVLTSP
jgi:hypothetical protein